MEKKREEVVSKFASLLGTQGESYKADASAGSNSDARSREFLLCLSNSVASHEVICTLPSLDIRTVEEVGNTNPLPSVGEHHEMIDMPSGKDGPMKEKLVPQMAASVLSNAADASAKAAQLEQKAAQSLGAITSWTKSSVIYAPMAIYKNVSDSFSSLVDSRVRAWTLLLLRHSLTTGDSASRSRLLSMLSSIIKVNSAKTTFRTLPLPESAVGQPKEADVILPLLLEVELQVMIQSKSDTVTLRAPGTISANFDKTVKEGEAPNFGMVQVDIRLDTGALLDSMVQQARMVVFKAVAKATAATDMALPEGATPDRNNPDMAKVGGTQPPSLSGFSSALNLSSTSASAGYGSSVPPGTHEPAHRLQKAKSSALRLNSVLEGETRKLGSSQLDKTRKSRSVQWDHPMDIPKMKAPSIPSPKRQRVVQTSARLTSFKSFGRPHAGDFGSGPRNATFGDFGRKPIWGRDGKLANHPTPMQPSEDNSHDLLTGSNKTSKNATFDFQRPPIHLSSGLDLGAARRNKQRASGMASVPNSIPRTATALEGWLLKQTNTGGKL